MASFMDLPRLQSGYLENLRSGNVLGLLGNVAQTVRDETGVDDYVRAIKRAREGNFMGMLGSLGLGLAETGLTALTLGGGTALKSIGAGAVKGNLPRLTRFLAPLSLEEKLAAQGAKRAGVARRFAKNLLGPEDFDFTNLAKPVLQGAPFPALPRVGTGRIISRLPEGGRSTIASLISRNPFRVGYARGGTLGSRARGLAQITGYLPFNPTTPGRFLRAGSPQYAIYNAAQRYLPMIGMKTGFSPTGEVLGGPLSALRGDITLSEGFGLGRRHLLNRIADSLYSGEDNLYGRNLY